MKDFKLLLLAGALSVSGCSKTFGSVDKEFQRSDLPSTQYEAGDVKIAVQPPLVWYDVADRLNPKFSVSSADALLQLALPITSRDLNVAERNTSGGVGINFGGTAIQSVRTIVENTPDTTLENPETTASEEFERVETRNSGVPPELTQTAVSALTRPAAVTPPTATLGVNARQLYRETAGLYQEIQHLNAYLEADVSSETHVPFLFRTQLVVTPYAREVPYDVYSNLFFNLPDARIIPLLILDNSERSEERRIASIARQLEASVGATISGIGASAGLNDLNRRLRDLQSFDTQSIILTSQSGEKSLSVRIGAVKTPNGEFSIVPRSYDISFLALIPKGEAKGNAEVELKNFATMRNTHTGKRIPLITPEVKSAELTEILDIAKRSGLREECKPLMEYNIESNAKEVWIVRSDDISEKRRHELESSRKIILAANTQYTDENGVSKTVANDIEVYIREKTIVELSYQYKVDSDVELETYISEPMRAKNDTEILKFARGGLRGSLPKNTNFYVPEVDDFDCRSSGDDFKGRFEYPYICVPDADTSHVRDMLKVDQCVFSAKPSSHSSSIDSGVLGQFVSKRFALRPDQELFQRLRDYLNITRQSSAKIMLPKIYKDFPTLDNKTKAVLLDQKNIRSIVTLDGLRGMSVRHNGIKAELSIDGKILPARTLIIDSNGTLKAEFPSISGLSASAPGKSLLSKVDGAELKLKYYEGPSKKKSDAKEKEFGVLLNKSTLTSTPKRFKVSVLPKKVALQDGKGEVTFFLTKQPCPASAICEDAADFVVSVNEYPIKLANVKKGAAALPSSDQVRSINGFKIVENEEYKLILDQIPAGTDVKLTVQARNAKGKVINNANSETITVSFIGTPEKEKPKTP